MLDGNRTAPKVQLGSARSRFGLESGLAARSAQ